MTQLLHIDSSVLGANSVSRLLTAEVVAEWRQRHPDTQVEYLDLAVDTPNHFSAEDARIDVQQLGHGVSSFVEPPAAKASARFEFYF
ncbi:MAG: hypothetical protein EOO22_07640 [Comamonadaceae bacterium]|nr:MAG: hypothetical protein EOO22_07640 [Comamonadaceae bacterium]